MMKSVIDEASRPRGAQTARVHGQNRPRVARPAIQAKLGRVKDV